jgi:hypothetical protein
MRARSRPLSARLSWDEAHRLELLMRRRAHEMSPGARGDTCAACGAPLAGDGVRVAGVPMHPACLPANHA